MFQVQSVQSSSNINKRCLLSLKRKNISFTSIYSTRNVFICTLYIWKQKKSLKASQTNTPINVHSDVKTIIKFFFCYTHTVFIPILSILLSARYKMKIKMGLACKQILQHSIPVLSRNYFSFVLPKTFLIKFK